MAAESLTTAHRRSTVGGHVHVRATRIMNTSVEQALLLATDLRQWPQLFDAIVEMHPLTRGPLALGSRILAVRTVGLLKMRQVLEVTGISDSGLILHTEGPGPGRLVLSVVATTEADATRVTVDVAGRIAGPGGLVTPLIQRRLLRDWTSFLTRLDEVATAVTQPARTPD